VDVIHSAADLRARLQRVPNNVFVPTMGHLHDGHIQLINIAKPRAACTVVSIFVNRLQFGPREDFDRYPRTLEADAARLESAGVDVLFVPEEKEIYPEAQTFVVEPSDLQYVLEGAHRPGHFRGVATVVLKLFNLVMPHSAIFGKKDYQQYLVLRDMVRQFALPIEIIPAETVRAPDGLALSSRNVYLSPEQRAEAPRLHRVLSAICDELKGGARDFQRMDRHAMTELSRHGWQPDYVAVRRQVDLHPPTERDHDLVVLAAARLGRTRLIDNLEISLGS
jgi:pantoate--beta-alanine ligase